MLTPPAAIGAEGGFSGRLDHCPGIGVMRGQRDEWARLQRSPHGGSPQPFAEYRMHARRRQESPVLLAHLPHLENQRGCLGILRRCEGQRATDLLGGAASYQGRPTTSTCVDTSAGSSATPSKLTNRLVDTATPGLALR